MAPTSKGTGLVSSLVGVTVFLVLLLFAVHLVLNLYATSTVTAVAFDAARVVAGSDGGSAAEAAAERHARELLSGYDGDALRFTWSYPDTDGVPGPDVVRLEVVADHPGRLLRSFRVPYQHVERTVTVRLEQVR